MTTKTSVYSKKAMAEIMEEAITALREVIPNLPVMCIVSFPCENPDETFVFTAATMPPEQQRMVFSAALQGLDKQGVSQHDS